MTELKEEMSDLKIEVEYLSQRLSKMEEEEVREMKKSLEEATRKIATLEGREGSGRKRSNHGDSIAKATTFNPNENRDYLNTLSYHEVCDTGSYGNSGSLSQGNPAIIT